MLRLVMDGGRFDEDGLDRTVDHEAKERRALEAFVKVVAQTIASAGLLIGGPPGALVGAGIAPLLEMWATSRRRAVVRRSDAIHDETGLLPEQFAAWVAANEDREVLAAAAISAAHTSATQRKLIALARVVAEGVRDEERLHISLLIVQALSDLNETHVVVLNAIGNGEFVGETRWGPIPAGGFLQAQLEERFASLA